MVKSFKNLFVNTFTNKTRLNMFNKKTWWLSAGILAAISPLAVIAACANTDNENSQQKIPTILKAQQFKAADFNLIDPIEQSLPLVNAQWLVEQKKLILDGTTELLTNANQVNDFQAVIKQDVISVKFTLKPSSYIDQNGQVAKVISSDFNFTIANFKPSASNPDDQPEAAIDLNPIVAAATFSVNDKNKLASTVKPEEVLWDQALAHSQVSFKVNNLVANDQTGKLGYNITFYQTNIPTNMQIHNIGDHDSKAISGFLITAPNPSDQQLVAAEIKRLQTTNPINVNQLSTIDIANYKQQPQTFIEHLDDLKTQQFSYQVLNFNVDQNDRLAITLRVANQGASATVELSKNITVLNISVDNPQWLRETELKRLNKLAKNNFLTQTTFSDEEIEIIKANPNLLLGKIFKFVSQPYFHYRLVNLDFKPKTRMNQSAQYLMSFQIEAKLWKTLETAKPTITSDKFNYEITVNYQTEIPVPQPTPQGWKIQPSAKATPELNPDGSALPGSYDLAIDLNKDQTLDLAKVNWDDEQQLDQLLIAIFNARQDLFIEQTGVLPSNWDWNNYTVFYQALPISDSANQVIGIEYTAQFDYVDSSLLNDPDNNWFSLNVKLTNGYNSGQSQPAKPDPTQLWAQYLSEFQALVAKQQFDETKLHLGNNEIYSFSQINADNPIKNDFFANFLNFSATEFNQSHHFLVNAYVSDASINYLTNTVRFKWNLEGLKDLSGQPKWTSDWLELTYHPSGRWKDVIQFQSGGDLAIANATSINNILDRFALGNQFVGQETQKDRFQRFGKNWTWKARELVNYVRFTFYQAFNDGATAINMAIENLPQDDLAANPNNYSIILKAKLSQAAQGNYLPYLQMFGLNLPVQATKWHANDVIEIRLDVINVDDRPDVVTNSNEIFPGMGPGSVLGTGQGAVQAYLSTPPRNDLYSIALGSTALTIKRNGQTYLNNQRANHRFLALNMLSRYDFQDPIWKPLEPPLEPGWTK